MSSSPEYNRFLESTEAAYSSPGPPPTVEDSGTGSDAIQLLRWFAGRSPPHLDEEEGLSLEDLRMRNRREFFRLIDWAEIYRGMQDCPFQIEPDEALAEGEGGGAPPDAKSAIEALETFEVEEGERRMIVDCAVCKDAMVMGEIGKKLPCGHCYHGNCIVPWLRTRNSCPLCRFHLQTDDEEDRKKRTTLTDSASAAASSSSQQVNRRMSNRIRKPNRRYL